MKFNDKELDLIIDYNYDPDKITKDQLNDVKDKELRKAIDFLTVYEENYYKKKEAIDKVDPTFFPEVVDFEIKKIKEYLIEMNPAKLPIDFFKNYFKKNLVQVNEKISFELEARLQYISMIKQLEGKAQ